MITLRKGRDIATSAIVCKKNLVNYLVLLHSCLQERFFTIFFYCIVCVRKGQKARWLNFVFFIGYIHLLACQHFSWKWNSLAGHFSRLFFFSISFPQNPRKQVFVAEFCITSATRLGELYGSIYSVSLKYTKVTQDYSAAYTVALYQWCFFNFWLSGSQKKYQLFHHVSEIFLVICQE